MAHAERSLTSSFLRAAWVERHAPPSSIEARPASRSATARISRGTAQLRIAHGASGRSSACHRSPLARFLGTAEGPVQGQQASSLGRDSSTLRLGANGSGPAHSLAICLIAPAARPSAIAQREQAPARCGPRRPTPRPYGQALQACHSRERSGAPRSSRIANAFGHQSHRQDPLACSREYSENVGDCLLAVRQNPFTSLSAIRAARAAGHMVLLTTIRLHCRKVSMSWLPSLTSTPIDQCHRSLLRTSPPCVCVWVGASLAVGDVPRPEPRCEPILRPPASRPTNLPAMYRRRPTRSTHNEDHPFPLHLLKTDARLVNTRGPSSDGFRRGGTAQTLQPLSGRDLHTNISQDRWSRTSAGQKDQAKHSQSEQNHTVYCAPGG